MEDSAPSAKWQEGEESMRWVRGAFHNAGGFADAEVAVRSVDGGKRDPDDLFSGEKAGQEAFYHPSVECG